MAYKTQSPDTSRETEEIQFKALRRMSGKQRLQLTRRLSQQQLKWAWSALKRANPQLSERELQVKAVSLWYGSEAGERLECGLRARGLWN